MIWRRGGRCLLSVSACSFHTSTGRVSTHFLSLITLCRNPQHLKPLTSLLTVHGLLTRQPFITHFIKQCFHLGASRLALSSFKTLEKPSLFLLNLMVKSLCNDKLYEDVLYVYQRCRLSGCLYDDYTFPFVIKACSALNDVNLAGVVHGVVLKTGFEVNVVVQTALIDFYSKIGDIGSAHRLLGSIPEPDLVAYSALISGCSYNGLDEQAFKVFKEMCELGLRPNTSTLASVIPVSSRLGNLDIGRSLHCLAVKVGHFVDERLIPAMISMYAGYGELSIARGIFDCAREKNVTICNAMISAYTRNQEGVGAFKVFQDMLRDSMQPCMVTFVSIIPSCQSIGSISYGESLHCCVIKLGFVNQASVLTALFSMYGKVGDVDSAEYIFNHMPNRNLLSWNSMISAYVSNGLWDPSLAAFREMQFSGFDPDSISVVGILSSCSELEAILLGKSAHAFSLKKGIDINLNASNAFLVFYSDCGDLASSFKLFNSMVVRNVVSWNTLVSGCINNGEADTALWLFDQMQRQGLRFDLITLISILLACKDNKTLAFGMTIHSYAIKYGLACDVSLANSLISMYLNCGELKAGNLLFEEMPNRSLVSWNALMTGYRYLNLQQHVMTLFSRMIKEKQEPNYVTLLNVLPACYTHSQGKAVHAYAIKTRIRVEIPLLTSLMLMYARFENIKSCLLLFNMGEHRDISVWNAIISALVYNQNAETALYFFCKSLRGEMNPDYVTCLSLISVCTQLSNWNFSNSFLCYLIKKGFDRDVTIGNALIDMYARCGNVCSAKKLFDILPRKDAFSWSIMINGYGLHGDGEAALTLLQEMRLSGLQPDDVTYLSILSACSHAGLVEQARTVFNSMTQEGLQPRMQHYASMIDLLSRTGHLDEAYHLVKCLPQEPSTNLLESLLGACLSYGNVELGEEVGRLLIERSPKGSGAYVVLYNIYAAAGRWTDANRVRSEMEEKQLRKVPGISLVDGNQ